MPQVATRSSSRNSSSSRNHEFRNFPQNKDLPPVPVDRPPFIVTSNSNSGTATPSDAEGPQRRHTSKPTRLEQTYTASPISAGTPKRSQESGQSAKIPETDVDVRPEVVKPQTEYYHEAWHNEEQRGRSTVQAESSRSSRLFGHRRQPSDKSADETSAPTSNRLSTKLEKGEQSPPLTGKDSAYSSVSGASMTSPAGPQHRSTPSMSPQAQFGLFPSSARSTPRGGSISGRFAPMSPMSTASSQATPSLKSSNLSSSRPDTAISTFSDASSKRLSKRSSFTSLKRLFTKKRPEEINSIPE